MNTNQLRRSTTSVRRLVLAVLLVVAATLGIVAPQASAYTNGGTIGTPGQAVVYQVIGTHFSVPCGPYACFQPGLTINGSYIYRSPATTGAQTVTVNTQVRRWNGIGWVLQTQRTQSLSIPAGYGAVRFGQWNVIPTAAGAMYVQHAIVWSDPYGRVLGGRSIVMNTAGDYVCQTRLRGCTAYAGFVTVVQP